MGTAIREIQYALRRLRGSPMFTIAATLTLAIAIGATASVFSLVDGVLLKAFPYRSPGRVLDIWQANPAMHLPQVGVSALDYLDLRAQNRSFSAIAASIESDFIVMDRREPERLVGLIVTPSYFPVVGVEPVLGRGLAVDSAGPQEVVISYGYWRRRFGGAASVLGQSLSLDGQPCTIVGVMPAGVPGPAAVWTRLSLHAGDLLDRDLDQFRIYGRLKAGVTPEQAGSDLEAFFRQLAAAYPKRVQGFIYDSAAG